MRHKHVGLRGKSFSTKMLKEEGESIAINSMCESKREREKDNEKNGREQGSSCMCVICERTCDCTSESGDGENIYLMRAH